MERLISLLCVFSMLFALAVPTTVSAVEATAVYTEIVVPSFLNKDGQKIEITADMPGFPASVHLGGLTCVPTEDPSYFGLDCGIKYTDIKAGSNSQILVEPMTYGETSGFLLYVKTPEGSTGVKPKTYIVYNSGTSTNSSKYQYSSAQWYLMSKGDTEWQAADVEGYAPTLPDGFEGYIYLPFDSFRNNASAPDWKSTDKICGLLFWDNTGADEIIYSIPMFVKKSTLDSNGLPTSNAVSVGDRLLEYFGNGSNLPEYYGEKINYGKLDICRVDGTEYEINVNTGKINGNSSAFWDGNSGKAEFIESISPLSDAPMVSTTKATSADSANHWLGSVGIKADFAYGGEAVMFYLKLPEKATGKSLRVDFGFDAKYNTYTYSGTFKYLEKGSSNWKDMPVKQYFASLPDGFEGYIMVPYSEIAGGVKPTTDNAVTSMNLRVTDLDGAEPTVFSLPVIVESIGETAAVYADGATKAARDPFSGESLDYEQVMVATAGANPGDGDCNGVFNLKDLVRMKKVVAGISGIARASVLTADMNGDSSANATDLTALRKRILNGIELSVETEKEFLPLTSDGDTSILTNPDRGFRTHLTLYVKEAVDSGNPIEYYRDDYDVFFGYAKAERINSALAYIYLTDYRGADLPLEAINAVEQFFQFCEIEEFKVMLRFAYCDDLNDLSLCADQATILRHIEQLAPVVNEYSHCIHTVECGFVGAYGEWASAYQKPAVDYETVIRAIVKNFCVPTGLFFSLRLPEYKNLISETDPYYSMIAHNNDAMYGETTKEGWNSGGYQYGTDAWTQVCNEGAYTPQGGEMLNNATMLKYGAVPSGIEMIRETAHHWQNTMSVWHGMFEDKTNAIMNNWRSEVITPEILEQNNIVYCPSWFKDNEGNTVTRYAYDFIRDHLGYKIEAQGLSVKQNNGKININLALKNYGMSAAFCMESSFVLLDENYNVVSKISAGEPDKWYSHNPSDYLDTTVLTHNVAAEIDLPKETGKYYIAFCLENTMGQTAKLSNRISIVNGYNILHEFEQ